MELLNLLTKNVAELTTRFVAICLGAFILVSNSYAQNHPAIDTILLTEIDSLVPVGDGVVLYNNTQTPKSIYTLFKPNHLSIQRNGSHAFMQPAKLPLTPLYDQMAYRIVLLPEDYFLFVGRNTNSPLQIILFTDPLAVPDLAKIAVKETIGSYMEMAMCGMVLMMMLYMLGKYVQVRTDDYLFYTMHLLFTLMFLVVVMTESKDQIWQNYPKVKQFITHFAQSASHACYFQFVRSFIQTRLNQPFFDKILKWIILFTVAYLLMDGIALLVLPPSNYPTQFLWHIVRVIYLIFGIGCLVVWVTRSSHPLKKYLVVGTASMLGGGLIGFIVYFNPSWIEWLPSPLDQQRFYFRVGVLIEIVSFSLGLGFKQRLDEISRAQAESKLEREHQHVLSLQELDQLKSRFLAGISHEFRTPLTLILGQSQNHIQTPSVWQAAFKSIHTNGRLLLDLVTQILDLSRIDAGKLYLHKEVIDPFQCVKNSAQMFHSFAEQKQIELKTSFDTNPKVVMADGAVLEKIVNNLLSNAIKYTPPGGSVNILCKLTDQVLYISVRDTGIGIPPGAQHKIFDRFYRVSEEGEGTGIGLALAKELVELHGGRITVQSEADGGTCFEVFIPVEPVKGTSVLNEPEVQIAEEKNTISEGQEIELMNKHENIMLIVEDHEELRNYIATGFKNEYQVITASHAAEGFEKAISIVPDIIVTDWMMPGMSGAELCHRLKNTETTSHIPLIMLTAKANTEAKVEGLTVGADDYVTKPFEWPELQVRVSNQIKLRKMLQEKFSKESNLKKKQEGLPAGDKKFIDALYGLFEQRLDDSGLSVEQLAREVGMSRVQLHRKTKSITGHSVSDLLRDHRLTKAADLLRQKEGNVSEVAYQVGFDNLSYFAKAFRQKYQKTPSEYKQSI